MPVFRWARDLADAARCMRGEMEAPTREAVHHAPALAAHSTRRPTKIKEKGKGLDRDINMPAFGEPIKQRDIVIFTRQFATMIDAGLPIVQCLDILAHAVADNKKLRGRSSRGQGRGRGRLDVRRRAAQAPEALRRPLRQHGRGRRGRRHSRQILHRLAGYMEKAMKLKSKIKGAMIYPASPSSRSRSASPAILLDLRDPGVRGAVPQLRQGAAGADAVRDQPDATSRMAYF